ncbi:ABC transporter permease [Paenibacillus nasutitermitis]|uniref:Peptide ABC transporter permease n=1 Tax=Paenibacillus nasutitermitis TaxID=1652958 RepID=A0A917E079_9BACL|nr:ABC transporter permease [Paenibacillus nasutitermitis]GGD88094.1 peptide ABC transporter permease [Paenibacillus nasutitermitis]
MLKYVLRRFFYMLVTLWVIVTITFFLMKFLPGNPFGEAAAKLTPENLQILREQYGLDKPLWQQYLKYMGQVVQGDLGVSYQFPTRSVVSVIKSAYPASFELGLEALIFSVIIGLFLGIFAALRHNKIGDYSAMFIAIVGVSIPSFVIGPLLSYFVGVKLKWLPPGLWTTPEHRILPALALALGTIAILARMMRASMLEVAGQDYIKTARAKGLATVSIVGTHMIRNAILPVVTILGPIAVNVLTGTLVIEKIFSVPGIGYQFVSAILTNDYTMITGLTIFYAAILVVMMFLTDVIYGFVDPRIRLGRGR